MADGGHPGRRLRLGLSWNAWSGRGIDLRANAFVARRREAAGDLRRRGQEAARRRRALPRRAAARLLRDGATSRAHCSLPEDDFERAFAQLEPKLRSSFDIVVYCSGYGCEASHNVTRELRKKGVAAVILNEGWPAWTDAGYPTRQGQQP